MPVDNSFYALLRFNKLRLVQDLHSTVSQSVSAVRHSGRPMWLRMLFFLCLKLVICLRIESPMLTLIGDVKTCTFI